MSEIIRNKRLDALTDPEYAKESVMLERVLDKAREFYKVPKNLQAFEAWLKNKEDLPYGTNYINP